MKRYIVVAILIMLALPAPSTLAADTADASRTWLDRPWEIRYVLFAEEAWRMQSEISVSRRLNAEQKTPGKERIYLSAAALFKPTSTPAVPGEKPIAVVLLTFDRSGHIVNQQGTLGKMSGKRNMLDTLVLISDAAPGAKPYYFAKWSQGIPGDVTFSPAVCSSTDRSRYEAGWDIENYIGNFGCREWTSQLYARDQPYIDVTSYSPRGTHIGESVGWSRFEDPPKPVIGRHGKTWLCLHECPAGEKPGVIPNIKAWTAKHGYPMPERPRKQPLYPNADYQDDLNE
ncbi:hypothetical protein [Massilia brevitalea]|uniref:hypothetical protein n=1 Tax=Massilia brevitalea TaxID=442526 RepID=UPI00273902F1|nr:hypothetical protein [Massilia brevitalea]